MHDTDRPTMLPARRAGQGAASAAAAALCAPAARTAAAALCAALVLSCSTVFTSSITGTVIDREDYDEGTTTGVADARVFLYTDETGWSEDWAAYVDGDESTLPDGPERTEYRYFQSTVTDAQGRYEFSGFVWEACTPEYGKTADRRQIYLLVYHPDYGLWKNPVPLYVVSDVTNRLDAIRITDLWNEGRMAGRVVDWSDGEGLGGVTVGFTVADSWTYDAGGSFTNVVFPDGPTTTVTTDGDGWFTADLRFRMMPDRDADRGTGPVRVTFARSGWRANDPFDGTGLANPGIVASADLDRDGRTAADGDYEDAYLPSTVAVKSGTHVLTSLPDIELQRWRFSVDVRGRVKSGATYLNGAKVTLEVPSGGGTRYTAYSEQLVSGDTTIDGYFSLGTVAWEIGDAMDPSTGEVPVTLLLDGAAPGSGGISTLLPDATVVLSLEP